MLLFVTFEKSLENSWLLAMHPLNYRNVFHIHSLDLPRMSEYYPLRTTWAGIFQNEPYSMEVYALSNFRWPLKKSNFRCLRIFFYLKALNRWFNPSKDVQVSFFQNRRVLVLQRWCLPVILGRFALCSHLAQSKQALACVSDGNKAIPNDTTN